MNTGVCKLCKNTAQLIGQSHLIPEFMYKSIKDKTEMFALWTAPPKHPKQSSLGRKPVQTGEFEGDILCQTCDNLRLGRLEDYFHDHLFGNKALFELPNEHFQFFHTESGFPYIVCPTLDFNKIKLFLISILWRAHISSRPMFAKYKLVGKVRQIEKALLTNNCHFVNDIGVSVLRAHFREDLDTDFVTFFDDIPAFVICEFIFIFFDRGVTLSPTFEALAMYDPDTVRIGILDSIRWNAHYNMLLIKQFDATIANFTDAERTFYQNKGRLWD